MLNDVLQSLRYPGIIAVVRASNPASVLPACQALVQGGVTALEITRTVPDAARVLREVQAHFGDAACVGAGSVLSGSMAGEMIQAGARFVVSPVTCADVVDVGHAAGCPVILGAYSPTEILRAHDAGADMVKVFPADALGPTYIRAVLAPMPDLRLVPTGGVDFSNAAEFFRAGCVALGLGSSLLSGELLERRDWAGLSARARALVDLSRRENPDPNAA